MSDDVSACVRESLFPLCPVNRPDLPHIQYRIGSYADFRDALVDRLDREPVLRRWTHRGADDPGIALLEGAAILGDILTFYQELYANEAFLRTAQWRESVADLVRLGGYRLAPGLGGRGDFAFEVRGDAPVSVPAGFPLTAQLTGLEGQADFQTVADLTAYPWLSRFSLYRPVFTPNISGSTTELRLQPPDGGTPPDLQPGDRLLLGVPDQAVVPTELRSAQTLIVDAVRERHGETLVSIKGALQLSNEAPLLAGHKLGRSFRHFGHNSPPQQTIVTDGRASQINVEFTRNLASSTAGWPSPARPALMAAEVLLDEAVDDLALGATLIGQIPGVIAGTQLTRLRRITGARKGSYTWGAITGEATAVKLDSPLASSSYSARDVIADVAAGTEKVLSAQYAMSAAQGSTSSTGRARGGAMYAVDRAANDYEAAYLPPAVVEGPATYNAVVVGLVYLPIWIPVGSHNIRDLFFHETVGSLLRFEARAEATAAERGTTLGFVGSRAEADSLLGRRLVLLPPGREPERATVQAVAVSDMPPERRAMRAITLDREVDYNDFPLESAPLDIFGNVVGATQGKAEREAVLGNGDSRATFQTFKLPKAPLTYLSAPGETPAEAPELQVYVNGRLWKRVPSFFGRKPADEVYVVREDAKGDSWVQFGDGKTGARLPSGVGNVVARQRSGIAAYGSVREGTTVQGGARLDRLDAIQLPGVVSGGTLAESSESARAAAPGRIQALGRLVSLADFESETLAIAGVSRAAAAWAIHNGVPGVVLTVLMDTGRDAELQDVRSVVATANKRRGPARFPITVRAGWRLYFYADLTIVRDPTYREEAVLDGVRRALGVAGLSGDAADGTAGRRFGERLYATQIEGVVQNVAGVRWLRVNALGADWPGSSGKDALGRTVDPQRLQLPASPWPRRAGLDPGPGGILALHVDHLRVQIAAGPAQEES